MNKFVLYRSSLTKFKTREFSNKSNILLNVAGWGSSELLSGESELVHL